MHITWQQGRWLPVFIKGGSMGLVDGVLVYAGGVTYPWRETEQAWYWDASRNDWFPIEPSLPLGRCYTHGATLQDGLLVLGGRKSTAQGVVSLRDAWWLRRQGGQFYWTQLPDMNYSRGAPGINVAGGKILVFGGGDWARPAGGAFTTRHLTHYEILDLDNLAVGWRDMGPLPFPSLVGSASATVGDGAYIFGGQECWTENDRVRIQYDATAWRYDFPTDIWTPLADFPCPTGGGRAVPYQNHVILIGCDLYPQLLGASLPYRTFSSLEKGTPRQRLIGAFSDLVFVYDIATDAYHLLAERLPSGAGDQCCAIAGQTIYVAGGETVDPPLSNCSNAFLVGTIAD